jgi:hypothetical protein
MSYIIGEKQRIYTRNNVNLQGRLVILWSTFIGIKPEDMLGIIRHLSHGYVNDKVGESWSTF